MASTRSVPWVQLEIAWTVALRGGNSCFTGCKEPGTRFDIGAVHVVHRRAVMEGYHDGFEGRPRGGHSEKLVCVSGVGRREFGKAMGWDQLQASVGETSCKSRAGLKKKRCLV